DDRALQPFPTAGPCHLESKWRRFKPDPKFKVKVKSQSGFDLVLGFNRTIFRPSVGVVLSGTTPESDRLTKNVRNIFEQRLRWPRSGSVQGCAE
uniref:hypothetical protein n=1 Tax=Buttiauxella sp. S19-1 TaxID=941430 RepID=UPI001EDC45D4